LDAETKPLTDVQRQEIIKQLEAMARSGSTAPSDEFLEWSRKRRSNVNYQDNGHDIVNGLDGIITGIATLLGGE
jgi:hypothetical protein